LRSRRRASLAGKGRPGEEEETTHLLVFQQGDRKCFGNVEKEGDVRVGEKRHIESGPSPVAIAKVSL